MIDKRSFGRKGVSGGMARRLSPSRDLGASALPRNQAVKLKRACNSLKSLAKSAGRSLANAKRPIVALLGMSGTGKSAAANWLASELGVDLLRVDLSAVVSKYIGETEKNLDKVFDAAEQSGAVLFFDEADALFGKRTEVRDAHDRYSNAAVDYLLQRIETFRGPVVLGASEPFWVGRLKNVVVLSPAEGDGEG